LFISDMSVQREAIVQSLNDEGSDVSVPEPATDALALLATRNSDIILLDSMLSDTPGVELCHHLKTCADMRAIPIKPSISLPEY